MTNTFDEMPATGGLIQVPADAGAVQELIDNAREEGRKAGLHEAARLLSKPRSGASYEMWSSGVGDWLRELADRPAKAREALNG